MLSAELYQQHRHWLHGWIRRHVGCDEKTADVVQDVFVRVLSRHLQAPLREPRAYLSSIARGLLIDGWRRESVERIWLEAQATLAEHVVPSPEEAVLALDALVRIDQLLDSLKPRTRRVFLMARLEGMSCPAIARHLQVSLSTVERDMASALHQCYRIRFPD